MNKSELLRLMGRSLLLFPLILIMPMAHQIIILLLIIWFVLLLIFLYPAILAYIAIVSYQQKGKETFKRYMSIAFKSGRLDPKSAATYSYILLKDGEIERASEVLDYGELMAHERIKWRKGEMKYNLVHSYRALILWKQDRLDDASDLLMNLYNSGYRTSILYTNLGWFLIKQKKYSDALEINQEALEYDRSNAALDNIGLVYLKLGDLKKSREYYEELIENNPTFPDAWFNYGILLEAENESATAQEMYRKALSCDFSFLGTITKKEVTISKG
jgi:tetratricopeptide (TPR) repeat protein